MLKGKEKMKRKCKSIESVKTKVRHLESIALLTPTITLTHLYVLHHHVFNGSFCIDLEKGLATNDRYCEFCNKQILFDSDDSIMKNRISEKICDSYKIDLLLRELIKRGGSVKIDKINDKEFFAKSVKHLSWFMIQLMIINSPVNILSCDVIHGNLNIMCENIRSKELKEDDMKNIILNIQRSLAFVSRESQINKF